jgi:hypothetical protein
MKSRREACLPSSSNGSPRKSRRRVGLDIPVLPDRCQRSPSFR